MSFPFFLRTDESRGPMSLLQAAEYRLGPLTTWPSNILNFLFFEQPTFQTVMRLINFFYGNRVPCFLAIHLFYECNDYTDALMTEDFHTLYEAYKFPGGVRMGIYFDMWHEKFLRINGINKNQLEIVESIDHDISRGFSNRSEDEIAALRDQLSNIPYCQ